MAKLLNCFHGNHLTMKQFNKQYLCQFVNIRVIQNISISQNTHFKKRSLKKSVNQLSA